MKQIIQYTVFALLILTGNACQDNDNWTIVTDVMPGTYISGSATVYSAIAPAAAFSTAPIDGTAEDFPGIYSKYTWLKKDGGFTIVKTDAEGNTINYGKGTLVSGETTTMTPEGDAYTVPEDGLYFLIVNNNDNRLTILPAQWGVIGSATSGGWDSETKFTSVTYNPTTLKVEYKETLTMSAAEMKFRFNSDWGVSVPYGSGTVKIHTNMGALESGIALTEASVELKGGGDNLNVTTAAVYTVTLAFDLRTSKFSGSASMGEVVPSTYPEKLYLVGDAYRGWPGVWLDLAKELIPVNGTEGHFWAIVYLKAGDFKFSPVLDWKEDFGIAEDNQDAVGKYAKGGKNINVATEGYYQIHVNLVDNTIAITLPHVILKGDAAAGGWDSTPETDAFTVNNTNKTLVSKLFVKDGELRICAVLPDIDWWRSEFIVLDGKIVYRGNGGDQQRVNINAGGKVTLNFDAGTGIIE